MGTWLSAVHRFAVAEGVPGAIVDALAVYDRGGNRPWHRDFAALEAALDPERLAGRIRDELTADVDGHQASMFAARFESVHHLLAADRTPEARVLRVGLLERLGQVLDEGGATRALRVRGVVDYVYSRAALLWHSRTPGPHRSLDELSRTARFEPVAPGVSFARLAGSTVWGPQHICVLRAEPNRVDMLVVDAWRDWGPDQDLAARVAEAGAVAAFSGGFFLYSEPDIDALCPRHDPVGLLVSEGEVRRPAAVARGALVQDHQAGLSVRVVGPGAHQLRIGDGAWSTPTGWVNRARAARARGVAIVGDRVVATGHDLAVPLNGLVITDLAGVPVDTSRIPPGAPVAWRLPGVQAAMAGGPVLVRDGVVGYDLAAEDFAGTAPPRTFVDDETGDRNLLPRLAAGLAADGTLLVAAVDGRNAQRALGLGLHSLGELMAALGAVQATNLDGGSSKRMVVDGAVVDLPSIGVQGQGVSVEEVRPLHTAVLLHPR